MQFSPAQSSRSFLHILCFFFFHTLSSFGLSALFVVIDSSLTPPSPFFYLSFSTHSLIFFTFYSSSWYEQATFTFFTPPLMLLSFLGVLSLIIQSLMLWEIVTPRIDLWFRQDLMTFWLSVRISVTGWKWRVKGVLTWCISSHLCCLNTLTSFHLLCFDVLLKCECCKTDVKPWKGTRGGERERKTDCKRHQQHSRNSVWSDE